jgi:NAD(P)H-nitrite reductase large subunit
MRYLVIGSGPAAISAAEEIRKEDPEGPITMVTADPHPACSPVMLTYWMSGRHPRESLFFREPGSWAAAHRVALLCGVAATAIDVQRRRVTLSAGDDIAYDRLLIATGAVPVLPSIPGIRAGGVYTFRTLADAEGILASREETQNVCIMGGGFIGIKLACHLRDRGLQVSIFEKEPRLASRVFDQRASDIVQEQLRRHGLRVETGVGISEILNRNGRVSGVRLEDGRAFPAQILVAAVGVRPNTAFVDPAIGVTREGIPVDERMETPVPDVYAAGDAASTLDSLASRPCNNAIWPAATRQGRVAGANMAGRRRTYVHNFSLNALYLDGLQVTTAGHTCEPEGEEIRTLQQGSGNDYQKWVLKSGALIGFILIGDPSPAAFLLSRIKRGDLLSDPAEFPARGSRAPVGPVGNIGFGRGALRQGRAKRNYQYELRDQE